MSTCWRPLKLDLANDDLPPFLISCTFTGSSYTIHVTDLTNIWSESLDKRAIERRSEDEETSINPVNDAGQLKILLRKLEDGLSGHTETSLSLSSRKGRSRNEPAILVLNITATLPKPLEALKWPVYLHYTSQSVLTSQLTVPLIRAQNSRLRELEELIEILKNKDHVIQKLVDNLESNGTELAAVFAGAAGKNGKALPRHRAEERVKGLKAFDVDIWRRDVKLGEDNNGSNPVRQVLEEVFDSNSGFMLCVKTNSNIPADWEDWWQNLKDVNLELSKSPQAIRPAKTHLDLGAVLEDEEEDFQIQSTPPHRDEGRDKKAKSMTPTSKAMSRKVIDGSTDDEEDDLDPPSPQYSGVIPDSVPLSQPVPQPKRLGKIGGSLSRAPPEPSAGKPLNPPAKSLQIDPPSSDETASEDENEHLPPRALPPYKQLASPSLAVPRKGGLGKNGGQRKEPAPPSAGQPEESGIPEKPIALRTSDHSAAQKHENADEKSEIGHETRGKFTVADVDSPEPEETEMERADRKREEKRRELEQKAKAPAKKRRKF